jgi:integrase/recombinase XerD
MNFSEKLISKMFKDDYVRTDRTSALYLQIFIDDQKNNFPLHIAVEATSVDRVVQHLKSKQFQNRDYNLI